MGAGLWQANHQQREVQDEGTNNTIGSRHVPDACGTG